MESVERIGKALVVNKMHTLESNFFFAFFFLVVHLQHELHIWSDEEILYLSSLG